MRRQLLAFNSEAASFLINDADLEPYSFLYEQPNGIPNVLNSQEGLALKTYLADIFNNWLRTEYQTYISTVSAVSTAGDSFTIDQLNLSKKVYDMLNRIMVSGGTYHDWVETVYDIQKTRITESPMYMGGLIKELVFQEVVSNSETAGQPLGS